MPDRVRMLLEPRKSPVQARSTASVDSILEATVQVLLSAGKERLTTTKVAIRAGVSVGTLYQYFPNKSALLQAALTRHLEQITQAVEQVSEEQRTKPLPDMATALINTFLTVKMKDKSASAALYAVSSDLDGARISRQMAARVNKAIAEMLATSCDPLGTDPQLAAAMLTAAMTGIGRQLVESASPGECFDDFRRELIVVACAYLDACSARVSVTGHTSRARR